jgi:hypothetical protein
MVIHDGVLRQLLGVIGMGPAPKNQAAVAHHQLQITNSVAKPSLQMGFELLELTMTGLFTSL